MLPILTCVAASPSPLALALAESDIKTIIRAATYAVVLFTIIVQGLTLAPLVKRISD